MRPTSSPSIMTVPSESGRRRVSTSPPSPGSTASPKFPQDIWAPRVALDAWWPYSGRHALSEFEAFLCLMEMRSGRLGRKEGPSRFSSRWLLCWIGRVGLSRARARDRRSTSSVASGGCCLPSRCLRPWLPPLPRRSFTLEATKCPRCRRYGCSSMWWMAHRRLRAIWPPCQRCRQRSLPIRD